MPLPADRSGPRPAARRPAILRRILVPVAGIAYGLSLPLIAAFHLSAEGPILVLSLWIAVTLGGLYTVGEFPRIGRRLRIPTAALTALGFALVLLQLNVARRSLAEAWLELVRAGRAFGFFSFFAAELAGLFSTLSAYLVLRCGFVPGTAALLASASLIHGILYASPWTLCLAVPLGLLAAISSGSGGPGSYGERFLRRAGQAAFPLMTALILSLPFVFFPGTAGEGALLHVADLTPLVLRTAPALPLLLDVPGYGYGVGASRLSSSVYLTDAPLYTVQGTPGEVLYLGYAVFREWAGSGWREAEDEGGPVALWTGEPDGGLRRLRLTLEADLYDRVPLPRGTEAVRFIQDVPELSSADDLRGIRFKSGVVRGLTVDLYRRGDGKGIRQDDGEGASYLDPGPDDGGRIGALAQSLASDTAGRTAEAILSFLRDGFRYSLRTSGGDEETAMDRFLFQDRRGYCLYFAGAAVLLARHAGIPARLVEGFRVSLDGTGRGLARGVDSHAWAEFLLDGRWTTVEATPPFNSEDPFRYTSYSDRASMRQLSAIFGAPKPQDAGPSSKADAAADGPISAALAAVAIIGLSAAVVLSMFLFRLRDPLYRLRLKAASLVRRGRRMGIAGPEVLGWTVWAERMGTEASAAVAAAILRATFDPRHERPSRRSPLL